ncbi:ABC transporter substrate-binding protein [Rhizobium sp. TRM95111]|uniref:ABC transporter substrate-binding protein n=1 Tax=Rhizobium alarense TaxID=2846851 RepID=UPI001F2C6ECF|nr:ABC transporter substrate-binding protein [Rhizobium alarense]MCF3642791.1 ABC transporter substrate-binding protein [Rhizobium alarense]
MSRLVFLLIALVLLATAPPARADVTYPLTVTDAIGRTVTIPAEPKAVLLGSGFNLVALSLIHPHPVSLLAGWANDMKGDNPEIYARFRERFPAIEDVPMIGDGNGALSFETILTLKSDLAILANWQAETEPGKRAIAYLEEIGVPTVVVDFNSDALAGTPEGMRLLGRILNREEQANAFADFYDARIRRIRERVAAHPEPGPTVLMDAFPNPDRCCYAYGVGGLGEFIAITGSRNVAETNLPRPGGIVSAEYVIAADPDVYIATASPGGTYSSFSIGPGVPEAEARETLARVIEGPILANLKAVREGRVHGLWNFFNTVPLNVLAAEAFARWLRPELFADVDPAETLKEINARFAAVPFDGAYWISLTER